MRAISLFSGAGDFERVRRRYEALGMYVGTVSIDDLINMTLSEHVDADVRES